MPRIYYPDAFTEVPAADGFDPACLLSDAPCAHIIYGSSRCSVWWGAHSVATDTGCIGHFAASPEEAPALLNAAMALLRAQGCAHVLSPINGNTWRSYRYATGGSGRAPFLMEPPPAQGRDALLTAAGFAPVNRYASYIQPLGGTPAPDLSKLKAAGITLRPLDLGRLEEELDRVYDLAVLAFRANPYYTDLPRAAFVRQYLGYRAMILPELVPLAFRGDELAGFLFTIPDYLQGQRPDTLLLKTIAVAPGCRGLGLGHALMNTARHRAAAMGFTQAIEALVYQGNVSEHLCNGTLLREYTLFGRAL